GSGPSPPVSGAPPLLCWVGEPSPVRGRVPAATLDPAPHGARLARLRSRMLDITIISRAKGEPLMALDMSPQEKAVGDANFKRTVGQLANSEVTVPNAQGTGLT